jgi:hypothetical protein
MVIRHNSTGQYDSRSLIHDKQSAKPQASRPEFAQFRPRKTAASTDRILSKEPTPRNERTTYDLRQNRK